MRSSFIARYFSFFSFFSLSSHPFFLLHNFVCLVISDDAERFASAIERARIKGGSAGRRKIDDDDRPAGKSIINLKRNTDAGTPHKPWCVYRVCVRFSTLTRGRSTTLYTHCVYVYVSSLLEPAVTSRILLSSLSRIHFFFSLF